MYVLNESDIRFPNPLAVRDSEIIALGGNLELDTLIKSYRIGAFPWFAEGAIIQWWHPDPRFVLFPEEIYIAKSMRSYFNQEKYHITIDQEPARVLQLCATVDGRYDQTRWLSERMMEAYLVLHHAGYMHSIEVRESTGDLVGGLYGVAMGKVFFGESMFSLSSNASKFGLITLAKLLEREGFYVIDCQMPTRHLAQMGGRSIPRKDFVQMIKKGIDSGTIKTDWSLLAEDIDYAELIK